ncbi:MAG: CDF family Co(II)/Ni(II) efflux transporter DmeF [Deltaproteobacteria bacterium]|jgi:cation diffusion facilitator family transporter|nr:CDF family Co(II)/Ni(II) efflux transporter DmeF [Deltaproteobacteria bacterium]MBW2536344.1 CDF family Co(II)/Ni(II) efflux transporter DmeF [Deltaproteobacteria bacterium]
MNRTDTDSLWPSRHDHVFGQDQTTGNERRTLIVVAMTAVTMVVEIGAGLVYGSMALLADGLHMASHAVALGIAVFAYRYARQHARDRRYSFGTGKVNALAGYSGAVLLGVFALGMAAESVDRFVHPIAIAVDQALVVAVVGLVVNGASVLILGLKGHHGHGHDDHHHHDHNLRSAYLHVLADALTSLLAIGALLAAKLYGLYWLDPLMGVVGAILVAKWSLGLLRQSGGVLLDRQASDRQVERIRDSLERLDGITVVDLHVWSIGMGRWAAIIALESRSPRDAEAYKRELPSDLGLAHVTVEVCAGRGAAEAE